jgi:hypothetical protein
VTDILRKTLGNHYQTFIDNFDVFGEPHTTQVADCLLKAG